MYPCLLNMKHKEYCQNFIIDLGLKYYRNHGDTVGVSIIKWTDLP